MTKNEYSGYQIIKSAKYKRFYAMYDLFRVRKPEPYSKLRDAQKAIIDEIVLELSSEMVPIEWIPQRIKNAYQVVIRIGKVRDLIAESKPGKTD